MSNEKTENRWTFHIVSTHNGGGRAGLDDFKKKPHKKLYHKKKKLRHKKKKNKQRTKCEKKFYATVQSALKHTHTHGMIKQNQKQFGTK